MTNFEGISLEQVIVDFEQHYHVSITIIDRNGFFHDQSGAAIFPRLRHSHQKHAVCKLQFDQRCVDHCRHAMNREGLKRKQAWVTSCWKGVSEIAVPLFLNGNHLGTCYIGQWQAKNKKKRPHANPDFKNKFLNAYAALPAYNHQHVNGFKNMATFIAQSLVLHVQALKHSDSGDTREQQIMQFLQQTPGPELSLHNLARHLALSPSRCSHVVKEHCKRSLSDLILDERIRRACQLLHNSDRSVQEIADITGFSDQFYFNKVFKARLAMPPGRYRKTLRQ